MDGLDQPQPRSLWRRLSDAFRASADDLDPEAPPSRAINAIASELVIGQERDDESRRRQASSEVVLLNEPRPVIEEVENRVLAPTNPQTGSVLQFIGPNPAGVRVTQDSAFMTAAVWACMDVVASSLAASDWNVYAGVRGSDSNKQALPGDQTQFLLNSRCNPEMTALSGKRAVLLGALAGNGYAEIEWDGAGRFASLWPIDPMRVAPTRGNDGRLVYRCTQDMAGGTIDLDPVDVFHIRGASLTGTRGDDAIGRAIRTIALNIAMDEFASSYYANGTNLGGILTTKGKLGDEAFERLRAQFSSRRPGGYTGARNANRTAIMDGGATYTPLDSNAQKADLGNMHDRIVEEVCRWFRVPPHKIAHLLHATFSNIEHQGLEFTRDTLRPWQREIEQEADYKLLNARTGPRFIELDLDWASQGDYDARARAFQTLMNTGVFSINDVRRKLGENTIGKAGDVRLVQGAMIPLERAGESYRITGTPTEPESPDDPNTPAPTAPSPRPQRTGGTGEPKTNAVLQSWLEDVYLRGSRLFESRKTKGAPSARRDSLAFLSERLTTMKTFLVEGGDTDQLLVAETAGLAVIDGRHTPAEAAAEAMQVMQERKSNATNSGEIE